MEPRVRISNERLLKLAEKHRPAPSWYEEDFSDLQELNMEPLKRSYWEIGGKGDIVGMLVEDAAHAMSKEGFNLRVVGEDGKGLMGTDDFISCRANVETVSGKIVRIIFWG